MRKKVLIIYLLTLSCFGFTYAVDTADKLIGNDVSIFYPKVYDAKAHTPSFALLKEPTAVGEIPANWSLKPIFYSKNGKAIAALAINKGTSLYGTGENTGSLLRNGNRTTLWNTDNYKYSLHNGKRLYQSHPWVLGVNKDGSAFGVIADNTWKQELDLSDSIRFISDGPAFRVIVIRRNSPQEVMTALADLIGKMEMPPLWSLGYQQCRYSYVPDTRIKNVADTFTQRFAMSRSVWNTVAWMRPWRTNVRWNG